MKKSAPPHVINVYRDKLVTCTSASPNPLIFKFTATMVSDLDVVNREELNAGLKNFVGQNKLRPMNLVIILHSSVYFEKDYPGPGLPPAQSLEEFIDTIPFSATSSKLFRSGNGYKQVVINRDLYESLKKSFEGLGYSVSAVVPGFVLGMDPQVEITAESCRVIYKKMDQIITESFTGPSDPSASLQQKEQMFLKRYQLPAIIISLLALAVAAVVVPLTLKHPVVKKKILPSAIVRPTIVPAAPTPEPSPLPPSVDLIKTFSVQILNASGKAGQAASLSARLRDIGFTDIRTGNNPQVSDKTMVVLSPRIASAAGEFVTDVIKLLYPDLSAGTNNLAKYDLTVIIGKNTP